jgi:hypothetical protein
LLPAEKKIKKKKVYKGGRLITPPHFYAKKFS